MSLKKLVDKFRLYGYTTSGMQSYRLPLDQLTITEERLALKYPDRFYFDSGYYYMRKKVVKNPRKGRDAIYYQVQYRMAYDEPWRVWATVSYLRMAEDITRREQKASKRNQEFRIVSVDDKTRKIAREGGIAQVQNVSMGYYDASGFHPIRASHDYEEDRVDEHYHKRPVRKYAQKEKAFKKKNNAFNRYAVYWFTVNDSEVSRKEFAVKSQAITFANTLKKTGNYFNIRVMDSLYGKVIKEIYHKKNGRELFNTDEIDKLSNTFQGYASGKEIRTVGSDFTPPLTARLGKLVYIKLKNGKDVYEATFNKNGDAYLSADARKNLYLEGKDARIQNLKLPQPNQLQYIGEVQQLDYITAKAHIENGQLTHYYHNLGEVDGIKPNAFVDSDGFILLTGGNYDILSEGIAN